MATYKVLQDIESEDKLFGPFTLKQFIFGFVAIGLGFAMGYTATLPIPTLIKILPISIIFPPFAILLFLALPLGREQPNDVWLFAQLRFYLKDRARIWNQEGLSELVTITVPKREERTLTNSLSQGEVKSRLGALANTLDSRGWAVKNVNTNMYGQPGYLSGADTSDRLVATTELPQDVNTVEVLASDDMFDPNASATAANLDRMMQQSAEETKKRAIENMSKASVAPAPTNTATPSTQQTPQDYWFMNQTPPATQPQNPIPTNYSTFGSSQVVSPGVDSQVAAAGEETEEEKALAHKLAEQGNNKYEVNSGHIKVLQPLHDHDGNLIQQPSPTTETSATPEATAPTSPGIDYSKLVDNDPLPDEPGFGKQTPDSVLASTPPATPLPPIPAPVAEPPQDPSIQTLALNNDLNISTLSREANRVKEGDDGEVIISLH